MKRRRERNVVRPDSNTSMGDNFILQPSHLSLSYAPSSDEVYSNIGVFDHFTTTNKQLTGSNWVLQPPRDDLFGQTQPGLTYVQPRCSREEEEPVLLDADYDDDDDEIDYREDLNHPMGSARNQHDRTGNHARGNISGANRTQIEERLMSSAYINMAFTRDEEERAPGPEVYSQVNYYGRSSTSRGRFQDDTQQREIPEPMPTYDITHDNQNESLPTQESEHLQQGVPTKHYSEDELTYRLKLAHLSSRVDWFHEISTISKGTGDTHMFGHVLDSLREYPISMAQKLNLSRKLRAQVERDDATKDLLYRERLGCKHRIEKFMKAMSSRYAATFELWNRSIASISARFGTNVASYFQFLRFLTQLNLLLGVIMFIFIVMPQIISGEYIDEKVESGFFAVMSKTIVFYGAYNSTSLIEHDTLGINWTYERPLAYLMTWIVASLLALVIIVYSMFVRYRRVKRSDGKGEELYSYHSLVGWDHSITSRQGSKLRSDTMATMFKELIRDEKTKKKQEEYGRLQLFLIRTSCNILSIAILAASAYVITLVANSPDITQEDETSLGQAFLVFLDEYKLPIMVSVLKLIIPRFLSLLLGLERYQPRTKIKLEVARTASFYVASVVVFLASIYSTATKCTGTDVGLNNSMEISDVFGNSTVGDQVTGCCWENEVGEQILQLVILDLLVNVGVSLVSNGGRAAVVKVLETQKLQYPDFQVGRLILDLVYGQCLVWLGLYFIPGLALVAVVKLFVTFYFNQVIAITCCVPPSKVFRASRSGSFYLFVLAASLFVCLMPMVIGVIELPPSPTCGPFRNTSRSYDVILSRVGEYPSWVQDVLYFISTPGFVIPLVVALLFLVLYYRAKSTTHALEAKDLRHHLQFERKVEKRKMIARVKQEKRLSLGADL